MAYGLEDGDYSSPAGQNHIHQKCICALPGLLNKLKNTPNPEERELIRLRIEESVPDNIYQDILGRYF